MSAVEAPSSSNIIRASYYVAIHRFIDSAPAGQLLLNPLEMRTPTPIMEALRVGFVRGIIMEDAQAWDLLDPEYTRAWDNGIVLTARPLWRQPDILGLNARFFPPHSPERLISPMQGLQLTPSGDVEGAGKRQNSEEEDLKVVEAAMGIAARAIRMGRLLTPEVYLVQVITGNDYPKGISPHIPR